MMYLIIASILFLQGTLMEIVPIFKNIDEIIFLLLFFALLLKFILKKDKIVFFKYELISLVAVLIFFSIGNISYWTSKVDNNYLFATLSGIATIKSILIYYIVRILLNDYKIDKKKLAKYNKILNIIIWIYFIIAIVDMKLNFLNAVSFRYGIKNISMGFSHPSTFEYFIICIMIIRLFISNKLKLSKKFSSITIIQCSILVILGGRSKGIAFIAIFLLCYLVVKFNKNFKLRYILYLSPILIYMSYDRIISSLFTNEEARSVLYRTGFKIANDYFPFGSGFSTFGSDFSRKIYSPIYYKYGINNVWGLSLEKSSFITDTQLASVLGECGYFGIIVYLVCILLIILVAFKIGKNGLNKLLLTSLLIYGIIASISDSILVSFRGTGIFFITALLISIEKNT